MTNEELIAQLQKLPPKARVFVDGRAYGVIDLKTITVGMVALDVRATTHAGEHEVVEENEYVKEHSARYTLVEGIVIRRTEK